MLHSWDPVVGAPYRPPHTYAGPDGGLSSKVVPAVCRDVGYAMTAALVGLIGVIAGALLGGVVNYVIERRKRWAAADAAGRLIAGELAATELRLQASSERKHWWAGDLPTEAWRTHAKDLGAELPGVLQDLSTVYVNVIDSWNAERAAADAGSRAPGGATSGTPALARGNRRCRRRAQGCGSSRRKD
jgi:hypothetical protein